MRYIAAILFIALLIVPGTLQLGHLVNADAGARAAVAAPGLALEALLDPQYYLSVDRYFNDRFSLQQELTRAKTWMDVHLFGTTDSPTVHVGRQGWLFAKAGINGYRKADCGQQGAVSQLAFGLWAVEKLAAASGRYFIYAVMPDKSTLYPEYVGSLPGDPRCRKSAYELFSESLSRYTATGFVRLDKQLENARSDRLLYEKADTCWNQLGARVAGQAMMAARQQIASIIPGGWQAQDGSVAGDLRRQLAPAASDGQQLAGASRGPANGLTAILYGDECAARLVPYLAPGLERIDTVVTRQLPSRMRGENPADYAMMMWIINESRLTSARIDMDRIANQFDVLAHADSRQPLTWAAMAPAGPTALVPDDGQLTIRSMGKDAALSIARLPGSSADTLRMLSLRIDADRSATFTVAFAQTAWPAVRHRLKPGRNDLLIGLPQRDRVDVRIALGEHAGTFSLKQVLLVSFGDDPQRPPAFTVEPTPSSDAQTAGAATVPAEPPSLSISDFHEGQIFQRNGTRADVMVSGTFTGRPQAIEARVVDARHGDVIVPWQTIDSAPTNGQFLGVLAEVPQGGWYRLQARFADQPGVTQNGGARWGVGMLVACIGQSNMKEWFFSGQDLKAHTLLRVHRNGTWIMPGRQGNGAIALGNRLIARWAIPVGLLDNAVNGSGLLKAADWGSGYWRNQKPGSIYDHFVKAVAATGGRLEAVIWMQGEADAARGFIRGSQYYRAMTAFIDDQVRADIVNASDRPALPFLVVMMPKRPVGADRPHQQIRMAQMDLADKINECFLAATTLDLANHGRQHLTADAYTTLGLRVAQTLLFLGGSESYYRGPRVTGVRQLGQRIIEVRIEHHGGNDILAAQGYTGWQIVQGKQPIAIDKIRRSAPDRIQIQLAKAMKGPFELRYMYGAMPDASVPVKDNSAMELPLEPFQGRGADSIDGLDLPVPQAPAAQP